jgi:hypothetical protein
VTIATALRAAELYFVVCIITINQYLFSNIPLCWLFDSSRRMIIELSDFRKT